MTCVRHIPFGRMEENEGCFSILLGVPAGHTRPAWSVTAQLQAPCSQSNKGLGSRLVQSHACWQASSNWSSVPSCREAQKTSFFHCGRLELRHSFPLGFEPSWFTLLVGRKSKLFLSAVKLNMWTSVPCITPLCSQGWSVIVNNVRGHY